MKNPRKKLVVEIAVRVRGDAYGWKQRTFASEASAEKWLDALADKVGGREALEVRWSDLA